MLSSTTTTTMVQLYDCEATWAFVSWHLEEDVSYLFDELPDIRQEFPVTCSSMNHFLAGIDPNFRGFKFQMDHVPCISGRSENVGGWDDEITGGSFLCFLLSRPIAMSKATLW